MDAYDGATIEDQFELLKKTWNLLYHTPISSCHWTKLTHTKSRSRKPYMADLEDRKETEGNI